MKNTTTLILLSFLYFTTSKVHAQDPTFTQWEAIPLHFNPALTGDFDGLVRFRAKYRVIRQSVLRSSTFKTRAASVEYKFVDGGKRKFSVGFQTLFDNAGQLSKNNSYNLTTSVIQNLGDPENAHHSIAVGVSAGLVERKLDLELGQWPGQPEPEGVNSKVSYGDVSVGLNWKYQTKNHFSFHLGSALHHLNKSNISHLENGTSQLALRTTLHGNVEIPLAERMSFVPSFLFMQQSPSEQLMFGLSSKWYLRSADHNIAKLGIFVKTTNNFNGTKLNVYVLSGSIIIKSFLLGLSIDHIQELNWNAYEFSVGYTFGRPKTNVEH